VVHRRNHGTPEKQRSSGRLKIDYFEARHAERSVPHRSAKKGDPASLSDGKARHDAFNR